MKDRKILRRLAKEIKQSDTNISYRKIARILGVSYFAARSWVEAESEGQECNLTSDQQEELVKFVYSFLVNGVPVPNDKCNPEVLNKISKNRYGVSYASPTYLWKRICKLGHIKPITNKELVQVIICEVPTISALEIQKKLLERYTRTLHVQHIRKIVKELKYPCSSP